MRGPWTATVVATAAARYAVRVALFAAVWWVVSHGYPSSWVFGVPFVAIAAAVSLAMAPRHARTLHPLGVLRYAAFFLWHSVTSGVSVAVLALRPSMPIDPGFIRYPFSVTDETARVVLADSVTLLPGTLSAGIDGDVLVMHALDCSQAAVDEVVLLERRVAGMLGSRIVPPSAEVVFHG